jgi:IclR family transcriptional regulator, acetate operon repressor
MNRRSSGAARAADRTREHDGTVQSLLRAIALLEILAEDDEGYRLVDLAARAGLSTSTTHRLLTTLEQKQFVQFNRNDSLWFIGVRCFSIGAAFARRRQFATLALPVMRRLRDLTGETVNLGLLDQSDVVLLTQVESRELMRAITRPGGRSPLPCTAMGQALLATMSDQDVAEVLRRQALPRRTPNSIVRLTQLQQALGEARARGYAVDDEENAVGLRCVAAVIYDELRSPYAAVSIAGPTVRVTTRRLPDLGAEAIAAAAEITRAIGGRLPETVSAKGETQALRREPATASAVSPAPSCHVEDLPSS